MSTLPVNPSCQDWLSYASERAQADIYYRNLARAVRYMIASERGSWTYITQWQSGVCFFRSPFGVFATITVDGNQIIEHSVASVSIHQHRVWSSPSGGEEIR